MDGWKCPGCGRCYAPSVAQCAACDPSNVRTGTGVTLTPPLNGGVVCLCERCGNYFIGKHICLGQEGVGSERD